MQVWKHQRGAKSPKKCHEMGKWLLFRFCANNFFPNQQSPEVAVVEAVSGEAKRKSREVSNPLKFLEFLVNLGNISISY